MAGKSDAFETDILGLIFNGTAITSIAQNNGSPITALSVSLHTADPTDAGTQGSGEANYSGYTRVLTTRSTAGWVVTGNSVSPVAAIAFPQSVSTSTSTLTHFGVGVATASTSGKLLYAGAISPNIFVSQLVTPRLTTGSSITED